jgi:hypothetical protein
MHLLSHFLYSISQASLASCMPLHTVQSIWIEGLSGTWRLVITHSARCFPVYYRDPSTTHCCSVSSNTSSSSSTSTSSSSSGTDCGVCADEATLPCSSCWLLLCSVRCAAAASARCAASGDAAALRACTVCCSSASAVQRTGHSLTTALVKSTASCYFYTGSNNNLTHYQRCINNNSSYTTSAYHTLSASRKPFRASTALGQVQYLNKVAIVVVHVYNITSTKMASHTMANHSPRPGSWPFVCRIALRQQLHEAVCC